MIGAPAALIAQIAFLSLISFGGVPGVLPALHDYVVQTNGWLSDRDFANCFAVVQAIPGPNMILMMSFIGWQVGGLPTAVASAVATFAPPCALSFTAYRFWDRFRNTAWQQRARRGLAPVTIGLVLAGGLVMAQVGDTGWGTVSVTVAAAVLPLLTRVNPLWLLAAGAALGGLGVL